VEETGVSRLSVMDHYFQLEAYGLTASEPMLEGCTTLGHLAAHTSTPRLGLLITGVSYRHPGRRQDRLHRVDEGRPAGVEQDWRTTQAVAMELGGNAPHIVFEDADFGKAVGAIIKAFVFNTGQFCMGGPWLPVHRSPSATPSRPPSSGRWPASGMRRTSSAS
jgi:hypothetical protein